MTISSESAPTQAPKVNEDEARLSKTLNFTSRIPTTTPTKQTSSHTPPKTPSNLPFRPSMPVTRPKSPVKAPNLSSVPIKQPQFLSKDSNLLAPVPWDGSTLEAKMENMEKVFQSFKTQMEGTTFERSHMKEAVSLFQARGEPPLFLNLMIRILETNKILQWWNWKQ